MIEELSCGGIVFYKDNNKIKYILIKHKLGKHWGFPKGHIEEGETEEIAALREIKEETDIDSIIIEGFKEKTKYNPIKKISKTVIFFLTKTNSLYFKPQKKEIDECRWASYEEALKLLTYKNQKELLKKAHLFLNNNIIKTE
jgi:8-oxo-dGTP pyrophosphatase MutT (NUDIX family)